MSADRREVLQLAMGAALLPLLATRTLAATPEGIATDLIAPPTCEMTYRRTLHRGLPGGLQFTTIREFAVRFTRTATGYTVTGEQRSARVEAPERLAAFARLEEQRVEEGVFPLHLDPAGLILDGPETRPSEQVLTALEEVRRRFSAGGEEVRALVEALHASGAQMTALLPNDLFAPQESESEDRREIALPWGDTGEVLTRFVATRSPDTRLMRSAMREVVTTLQGDQRRSAEEWELFIG